MKNQVLPIRKCKKIVGIGVSPKKASAFWHRILSPSRAFVKRDWHVSFDKSPRITSDIYESIPAFTLQDILDLLPKEIRDEDGILYELTIEYSTLHKDWYIGYYYYDVILNYLSEGKNILDAAYEMLCWCIENGYVPTKTK